MSIFNVFTLMGGIAMFLYGMDLMGKALEQTAGNKLQGIFSKMTASPNPALHHPNPQPADNPTRRPTPDHPPPPPTSSLLSPG